MNNSRALIAVAALTLFGSEAATAGAAADPVAGHPARLTPDQRAVQACADALIGQLLPDGHVRVRVDIAFPSQVLSGVGGNMHSLLDISLTARSSRTGQAIASSECVVDASAHVLHNHVLVRDAAALAALEVKDLRLAAN